MIRLFLNTETNFNHNKWILSDATVKITETVDGIFDMNLDYPLKDKKGLSKYLVRGNIIKSPLTETDPRGEQLFKIRTRTLKSNGNIVSIYAQCIARADLTTNFIAGVRVPAGSIRKQAGQILLNGCLQSHKYTIGNLDTNTNTSINLGLDEDTGNIINYLDVAGVNPIQGFLGEKQSVQAAYGGEIIYNNYEINIVDERGSDHSFIIKSGKNLQEIEQEISDLSSDFATALIMKSSDGYYLPNNEIIYSPIANTFDRYFYKEIVCDDVSAKDDTQESINIVYAQLRERGQKKFIEDKIDKLPVSNTVNFLQTANTEEYKNFSQLEKCQIGNNVIIKYTEVGLEATGRVVKIIYNPQANSGKGKIEEVEIGDRKKQTIVDTVNNTTNTTNNLQDQTNSNKTEIKKAKKATSDLQVIMEKRDSEIELSVTNLSNATSAKFLLTDQAISERVTNQTFDSYRIQTADKIAQMVSKGEFSSLIEQNYDSVAIAIRSLTDMNVIFDSDGQTINNGAFTIKDDSGNIIFRVNQDGSVGITDLEIVDTSRGSWFYNTLMNMDVISCGEIKPSRLTLDSSDFYINDGYDLREYIEYVVSNM